MLLLGKNKGDSLYSLGHQEEAIRCYNQVLELDPRLVGIWHNKAILEDQLGYLREAARSYQQFLALAPVQYELQREYGRKRLRELGASEPVA